ncbi:MAG: LysE family translocator [Giesbergeria sp.]|uniref:LysE family translocator n=1 Tax=Giesbergeria sp. TaxID=2818473 RepID=UPI00262EAB26|nr:LysE family translocator [Giesbergeria sp.]MDD2609243.1 LysE family translocator [Giesbergeria sp.]
MPTFSTVFNFFGVALLLALTPGPDNLFVLVQSMQRGVRVGLAVVLGLCLGLLVHTSAVALGLAAVLATLPLAFSLLQIAGAVYLAWLAWQALRPRPAGSASATAIGPTTSTAASPTALARMVGRGLLMNLSNPKVLLFFLAFLPQFTHPAQGSIASQVLWLGLVFMLATLLVFGAIACFSGYFATLLQRHAHAQSWLDKLAGLVFLALALRLLSSELALPE